MSNPIVFLLNTHGVWIFILVFFLYLYFVSGNRQTAVRSIYSAVTALFVSVILKELFTIPRPFMTNTGLDPIAGLTHFSSFPSAHTAIAFAFATSIYLRNKRIGVISFAISSIIGVGRVIANVHYPLDIVVGIAIGILIGLFFNSKSVDT